MPSELDNILISYDQSDFPGRLEGFFLSKAGMAHFGFGEEHIENRKKVEAILNDIADNGDKAISKYTEQFDEVKLSPGQFRITQEELKKAHKQIDKKLLASIKQAIENVRKYQQEVFRGNNKDCSGGTGIKYTPIKRIGICVPGASAPLPSTVIMTAVPAQIAGVKEIVVVSPPRYEGSIHPVILAVCHELKITEVYRIGGAQAVAALANGTKKIVQVDKIVGPGNQWVQTAKRIVFGQVGIDSIAGPSEVLIIANDSANPAWVAADMLSQAEHNPGCAHLFTDSKEFANKALEALKKQVKKLNHSEETIKCLEQFGGIVVFEDMEDLIENANKFAAEHLQIQCGDKSKAIAEKIQNAGAIFIGEYSPVAVGDYWAGPSHTLPTGISAHFFSALSSNDFVKSTSIIEYSKEQLAADADDIIRLAEIEGLDAHAKSVEIRQQNK
ncbi:MAG: histidinol dehydrogenase [Planctomycetes bacterium]|nr:histidinol dehydrogenase [Planctomycetota bacterium]